MNLLCDNDLHALLAPLSNRPNVKFTVVAGGWMGGAPDVTTMV